jgi:hypothetical protein
MKKLLLVTLIFLLTACASQTAQQVIDKHALVIIFETPQHYETVYRKACIEAMKHELGFLMGGRISVKTNLYPDIKQGHISIARYHVDRSFYIVIRIDGSDSAATWITMYLSLTTWERTALQIKEAILKQETK